jgi:uncharacterized protein YjcR
MKPATEALAYRIWALCQPRGWGMTLKDCAEELGENPNRVRAVVGHKGWADRFKAEGVRDVFAAGVWGGVSSAWTSGQDMRAAIQSVIGHIRHDAAE